MATNLYTLTLSWNISGQFAASILHYIFDDAGFNTTVDSAGALATKWNATAKAAFLAMCPSVTTLMSIKARKTLGSGGFEAAVFPGAGTIGTRVGPVSAAGINPVLIHYPLQAQAGRGKTFLPGVREADCKDGIWADAFVTAVNTNKGTAFGDLTLTGGGAPTAEFVVMKKSGTPRWFSVVDTILSDQVGQQRRRQRPV